MKIILCVLLFAVTASAQTVKVKLTCGTQECMDVFHVKPKDTWYAPLPVTHRTADNHYLALTVTSLAFTVADVENSMQAMKNPNTREADPLFGARPGRARYYGIMLPVDAGLAYISYRAKREDDAIKSAGLRGHKCAKWWVPQTAIIIGHAVGIWTTLGLTGR